MEDPTQKRKAATGENELAPSSQEDGEQPINSELPDWYIDLVHQAMERTGEDLSFYLYGTTKKTLDIYDAKISSAKENAAKENSGTKDETTTQPRESDAPAFHKRMLERAKKIPQEDRDMFPPDFSENLDHYLYGTPPKSP